MLLTLAFSTDACIASPTYSSSEGLLTSMVFSMVIEVSRSTS